MFYPTRLAGMVLSLALVSPGSHPAAGGADTSPSPAAGVLVGLKEGMTFRTVWMTTENDGPPPAWHLIVVPHGSDFCGIRAAQITQGKYCGTAVTVSCHREVPMPLPTATDDSGCSGESYTEITYVGPNYLGGRHYESSECVGHVNGYSSYFVMPMAQVADAPAAVGGAWSSIGARDALGASGLDSFVAAVRAVCRRPSEKLLEELDEMRLPPCNEMTLDSYFDNWAIVRGHGRWEALGWYEIWRATGYDFHPKLSLPSDLVTPAPPAPAWDEVLARWPEATDVFAGPHAEPLLVVEPAWLRLCARRGEHWSCSPEVPKSTSETIVMAEWAAGSAVARWSRRILERFGSPAPLDQPPPKVSTACPE
jgi:hypothetical protein